MQLQGRNLSIQLTGDDVKSLQQELQRLGHAITDREAQQGFFGQSTQAAVMGFQKNHKLPATGVVDNDTAALITHDVDALDLNFVVHGLVRHPDGRPVTDVIVAAFDKDLRSEERLGEIIAPDAEGRYEIKYTARQFSRAEKKSADLIVRVYKDQQLLPPPLAESPIIFNAQPIENIDLVFDNQLFRGPAEFDQLLADIAPVLAAYQLQPAQLNLDDIKFLSSDTGQPIERLTFLVAAHRLQNETQLPAEIYYGLFRQNLPIDRTSLLAQGEDAWRFALENAFKQNTISTEFASQLPPAADRSLTERVIAELKKLIVAQAFKQSSSTVPSLSSLLSFSIPEDKQGEFLNLFLNHKGPVEEFWKNLRTNPSLKDSVSDLQFTLQLHTLTNGHQPLISHLKALQATGQLASLKDLAKLDLADWKRIVSQRGIGLPAAVPGANPDEQATNYARAMTRLIERSFPTAFVANRIAADDLPGKDDLVRFFQSNQEFDLTGIRFAAYVAENPGALEGITNPDLLSSQISTFQRLYKIAPSYAQASVLMKDGLHSAFSITRLGHTTFARSYGGRLGGEATARMVYERAEQTAATALNLLAQFGMGAGKVSLMVAPDMPVQSRTAAPADVRPTEALEAVSVAADSVGDWETLFGSLDLCECEHCRSVYGPAAYFVDVLHFLLDRRLIGEDGTLRDDRSAKHALFERRPDLGEIELTCENTNTLLSYVDLVNEVLENAIASLDPSTSGAYRKLRKQVYPWSLPFDLWMEETRAYLRHLGVQRHEVMEVFLPGERATLLANDALAWEYLGLTSEEARLITGETVTGETAPQGWRLWGFNGATLGPGNMIPDPAHSTKWISSGDWTEVISGRVDVFLQQSRLSYKEMLEVLGTDFVNPAVTGVRAIQIRAKRSAEPDTCVPSELELTGWTEDAAVRFSRFVRLQHRLVWTARDLDKAITALRPESSVAGWKEFLRQLSHVKRLQAGLNLPTDHVLAFFSTIDVVGYVDYQATGQPILPSLYERLFRNRHVFNPLDPAFQDPARLSGRLTEQIPTIIAALNISAADFDLLLHDIGDDQLDLDHLSRLFRHATLARALRLNMRDYLSALKLIDHAPFASTIDAVLFVERMAKLRESGFTIAELNYLLRNEFNEATGVAPGDEEIALTLDEIRKELQKIAVENTFTEGITTDPDGETIRKKLALINWESDPIDQAIALLSGTALFETRLTSLPSGVTLPNDTGNYEASLAALPEPFEFPRALAGVVSYDRETHKLRLNRRLTHSEQSMLLTASTDADYRTAVNDLIRVQNDLQGEMRGEINYDPGRQVLRFVGPMSINRRDRILAAASPADSEFRSAVEALFEMPRNFVLRHMQAFVTPDVLHSMFDLASTPEQRFNLVLEKLMGYLRGTLSTQMIKQKLGEALKLESKTADELLTNRLHLPTGTDPLIATFQTASFAESDRDVKPTRAVFADQFNAFTLLHKAALIVSRFKLTSTQLDWPLVTVTPGDLAAFERLVGLFRLRDQLPGGESLLTEIFALARTADTSVDAVLERLSTRAQWGLTELQFLAGPLGFNLASPDAFKDERAMLRLYACFAILRRLGITAQLCRELSGPTAPESASVEQERMERVARGVLLAVRAKYNEAEWAEIAKPLQDVLRERKRQTLVAYLTTHPAQVRIAEGVTMPAWRDVNGIYAYYLIDVEMSPCQMTSRLKQAISSVQLFVQRCLMNLEREVLANAEIDPKWREWKWMKNYRIWEANRKIFLYPENWIEPELRDDKSPFFKELENELLQSDLTLETAETAFVHYLEKLDAVANLEIVGMYRQLEENEDHEIVVDVLHVFGRTRGTPHIYYYRRWVDSAYWTAWEKVDVDIEGDHLIPVVWNRRLHLFWPIFTEENAETDGSVTVKEGIPIPPPPKKWKIQLASSERKQDKWQARKIYSENILPPEDVATLSRYPKENYFFRLKVDASDMLEILLYVADLEPFHRAVWFAPALQFTGFNSDPRGSLDSLVNPLFLPTGTKVERMMFVEWGDGKLRLPAPVETKALDATPGLFRLLPPHEGSRLDAHPFFYADDTRTFFVIPEQLRLESDVPDLDSISPAGVLPGSDSYFGVPVSGSGLSDSALFTPSVPVATLRVSRPRITIPIPITITRYWFKTFYHPYVNYFVHELNRDGVDGLLQRSVQLKKEDFFNDREIGYGPTAIIETDYPRDDVDFSYSGGYSQYNWELFFHAPLLIADRLSKNQRFEEAQKWFHYIFDPTDTSSHQVPQRYWRTKPFFKTTSNQYHLENIPNLLHYLSNPHDVDRLARLEPGERLYVDELPKRVVEWRKNPFKPHLIARMRTTAYQKTVVMKYLDNLIAWGDQLFRRDTLESINEATQLFVLAAEILGRRPDEIPPRALPEVQSFNTIERKLDSFSNALVRIEEFVPPSAAPVTMSLTTSGATVTLPTMLYFCLPKNDKLLGYWDTVADRLFKIRHCMNIEGVARQLPLFEPPIDPGLLVKAAAAGVDLSSALSDVSATLPYYRFNVMAQKATELCAEVKALGGALLAALEKRDAEALSLLRSTHEINLLNAARQVKEKQLEEAKENIEGLKKSRGLALTRKDFYRSRDFLNFWEAMHLESTAVSLLLKAVEAPTHTTAGALHLVPNFKIGSPFSVGATYGGDNTAESAKSFGVSMGAFASLLSEGASIAATIGGYSRRMDDWKLQEKLATKEVEQIDHQITAAQIRLAVAEQELKHHDLQTENAKAVDEVMRNKFTRQELYDWMIGQVSTIYFQSFQLAYDVAKRAERAYQHELGLTNSSFIQFGYWDSLKKGLLAGERLYHDIKRLEVAYLDQNRREYEITRHISLAMLDPLALVKLRENGDCFVELPEVLFDMDYPGHYLRRIKSAGLTIPCVVGPYTSINCTLTLLANSVRRASTSTGGYARNLESSDPDPRFADNLVPIQSIATSSAQNDSGMFELNFHDERYLPFEGSGAISRWRIELPIETNNFDRSTISDVVIHLRYTAREGGDGLKAAALSTLPTTGVRLFDLRHEFPTQWHRFVHPTDPPGGNVFELEMSPNLFRFKDLNKTLTVNTISILARCSEGNYTVNITIPPPSRPSIALTLAKDRYGSLHFGQRDVVAPDIQIGPRDTSVKWKLTFVGDSVSRSMVVEDMLLVLGYTRRLMLS